MFVHDPRGSEQPAPALLAGGHVQGQIEVFVLTLAAGFPTSLNRLSSLDRFVLIDALTAPRCPLYRPDSRSQFRSLQLHRQPDLNYMFGIPALSEEKKLVRCKNPIAIPTFIPSHSHLFHCVLFHIHPHGLRSSIGPVGRHGLPVGCLHSPGRSCAAWVRRDALFIRHAAPDTTTPSDRHVIIGEFEWFI